MTTPVPVNAARQRTAAMPFIMLTVLIDMVSIGLIIPVLPLLVGTFTGSTADQTFWFGVTTFAFSIANFLTSPLLGALSDRHGRRPVLLLGFCALALSFFVTALATALWMLVVVRLFSGAQGNFWNSWRSQKPGEPSSGAGFPANPSGWHGVSFPAPGTTFGSEHLSQRFASSFPTGAPAIRSTFRSPVLHWASTPIV